MYAAQENSRADETESTRLSSRLLMATPAESSGFKIMIPARLRQMSHYLPSKRIATPTSTHNPQARVPQTSRNPDEPGNAELRQFSPVGRGQQRHVVRQFGVHGKLPERTNGTMNSGPRNSCYRPMLCPEGRLVFAAFKSKLSSPTTSASACRNSGPMLTLHSLPVVRM